MERDDDHLWHLACAFSIVLNPSSRNLDVYKELARVDAIQNSKELPESDAIYQLQEHGLKIQGPGGKIVCTESGKWIYKRGSHFMKTSSLRFLGKSFSFRRGSTLSQDSEEHQHTQLGIANGESSHVKETSTPSLPPPKEFSLSFLKPRSFSLRHLSTASPPSSIELPEQSKVSSEENVAASTVSVSLSSPPELSSPRQPSSPLTSPKLPSSPPRRGLYSSASARTIGSLGDRSNRSVGSHRGSDRSIESGGDVFPSSPQASAALLTLEDRCAISMEAVFEELIPAMVILELFHELNAQWTGLVEDSIAANQRRMLERVNSRIGLYRTGSKLDLIRQENHLNAQPHSLPQSPSSRSLVDANGDVVDSEELNTELLQEMLFDIAQNALDMPSVLDEVEQEMQQQLEMQSSVERERERKQTAKAVQQEQSSGEDNAMHSAVKGKRVKSGHQKRGTPEEAVLAMLNRQQSDGMSFNAEDFCMTGEEAQEERKSGSMSPSNDEKSVGTKSAGSKSVGSRSETNDRTGKISGKGGPNVPTTSAAPVVPLRRPSWQSKVQPLYLTKKRRPSMAVRLALNEAGPFQRILKEGIPVIIHFAARGSSRPRRIKRLMVLDDGSSDVVGVDRMTNARNTGHFDDDGDTRSQSSGHGMLASGDSIPLSLANHHSSIHHQKLKFFRLESGEIIECDGEMVISEIADIVTGVHTIVFKHSLTQLHGEGMSYDKTGTEKRCFSMLMMNSKSPYDDRPVLDVEIQPMDKQKPEELQAAAMISLGVATAIQIISNLENTTKKKNSALLQLFEKTNEHDDEHEDEEVDEEEGREHQTCQGHGIDKESIVPVVEECSGSTKAPMMTGDLMPGGRGSGLSGGRGSGGVGGWGISGGRMGRGAPGRGNGMAGRGLQHPGESSLVLPPSVLAQFEGLLPSEKLTINCIMQDVVNMWATDTTILAEVQEKSSNTLASSVSPKKNSPRTLMR